MPRVELTPTDQERADTFTRLLDALQEGVFVGVLNPGTSEPGRTVIANPALKRLFGLPLDIPAASVDPFAPARFTDVTARAGFLDRLTSEGSVSNYLLRMRKADESLLQVDVTAHVRATERGGILVDALLRDATERKRLDDRSRELYQQLLQNEKLAAIGQLVSGVAHELNNPLATILSWAERLSELPLDDVSKRGVDVIFAEAERSARIVRHLLTFVRKRASTRAMVDLNQVVRDTLTLRAYDQSVNDISTLTALAGGLPKVFVDQYQMQQVLLNLITNAEQAMQAAHGRGTLVVRTWHDAERNLVVLEVTDDGPGVPPENKARIFDAFFTTKEVGKGTGLGLSLAYSIVQEHGGRLRVDSVVGQGASFVMELPVTPGEPAAVPAPAVPATTLEGVRVLLVEDEKALATAMSEALAHAGLVVDMAGDGEEALARVRQRQYDVVVCDLKMPRVSGMMLYRAMAAVAPALSRRVIFVTGDVAATEAERFLADSGCRWLVKPFRIGDLLRAVRETLA
jgi:signal transduction histidine kinase/BarA-like signal transduction histidine kinase